MLRSFEKNGCPTLAATDRSQYCGASPRNHVPGSQDQGCQYWEASTREPVPGSQYWGASTGVPVPRSQFPGARTREPVLESQYLGASTEDLVPGNQYWCMTKNAPLNEIFTHKNYQSADILRDSKILKDNLFNIFFK